MSDYLENISVNLWDELGNPSGISSAYIKNWFIGNIGGLNILLNTSYSGVTGSISPQISGDAQFIFKELFLIKYFDRLTHQNLGAGAYSVTNDWNRMEEGDTVFSRSINRTDYAKTYLTLKKESQLKLDDLVKTWRSNQSIPLSKNDSISYISSDPMSYIELK